MTQPNVDFRSELAEHAGDLRSLAQHLVSSADAEDLTHDAMVTALSQTTKPRRVRPWLRQVLRNEARAQRRSSNRRVAREHRATFFDEPPSPETLVEHRQVATAVRAALVDLEPPYRRVLEERFLGERTAAEIARSEGCPAGTVRWRVQEGLRRMRSSLDARFEDREAWRGRMAAFAAAPLGWAPPPGKTALMSSSPIPKLAFGALTAATLAAVAVVATTGATEVVPERSTARPHLAAATTSQPVARSAQHRASAVPERASVRPAAPTRPHDKSSDDPGCQTCSEDGMPSFDALAECQERFDVSPGGRIDINVAFDGTRIDALNVRSKSDLDAELVACIEDGLPGSEATVLDGHVPPQEMNLALLPSTVAVPDDVDAPTPGEMAEDGVLPVRAQGDAPVRTVVACSDYDCQFCDKARTTLDQVLDEYPDLQLAWMHFPLHDDPSARRAARAAVAAQAQGKFWDMHALLYDQPGERTDAGMRAFAAEIGLNLADFDRDFNSDSTQEALDAQKASCQAAGALGTPSFFVNDTVLVGAQPIEAFRKLLD